jgi:hypothetical protein
MTNTLLHGCFAVVLLCFEALQAQTQWSGDITANTTWTKAASPHQIAGDLTIAAGATVTVEPGATLSGGNVTVNGRMLARGTPDDPIVWKEGGNLGIRSLSACEYVYCQFQRGGYIHIGLAPPGGHLIQHCVFQDCRPAQSMFGNYIIALEYSQSRILANTFRPRGGIVIIFSTPSITDDDCPLVRYNSLVWIYALYRWGGGDAGGRDFCGHNRGDVAMAIANANLEDFNYDPWPPQTPNPFPQADVDNSDGGNKTSQEDAELVKKHLVGLVTLTPEQLRIADVDGNGVVDVRDALMIESYVNGLIWKLPSK